MIQQSSFRFKILVTLSGILILLYLGLFYSLKSGHFYNLKASVIESDAIVKALRHTWKGYQSYAWGKDEMKPISSTSSTWMDAALTMIDSLDTLWIMGLRVEFFDARDWIKKNLSFDKHNDSVSVFETTIRLLGGLLSAYVLTGDKLFLDKATDLGDRILPVFDTPTGIPFPKINLVSKVGSKGDLEPTSLTYLADPTSIQLEFNELSRITGDDKYSKAAMKALRVVLSKITFHGLAPLFIDIITGEFLNDGLISFGPSGDSFYEYLLKVWVQRGKKDEYIKKAYMDSIQGLKKHLLSRSKPSGLLYVGELKGGKLNSRMHHLACFLPGTLAYGVLHGMPADHLQIAKELARTCNEMYVQMPTGISPDDVYFNTQDSNSIDIKILNIENQQRPETIESFYYLYKLTGDPMYKTWGWKIFKAFERYARVEPFGYVGLRNVTNTKDVGHFDTCQSFWIAETLKYFYLLFNDKEEQWPLTKYVFNTEAHPFPIQN